MKAFSQVAAAATLGIAVGALGAGAIRAATAQPPAFLIANITNVTDRAMLKKYQAEAPAVNAKFGGQVLVRGKAVGVDSASAPPDGTIVVIRFPDMGHLSSWYGSPDYARIKGLREKSSTTHLYAVEGLPPS